MKIFKKDYKINFVDENNVLVGFDSMQNCCESFGWFFTDTYEKDRPILPLREENYNFEEFVFDPDFFETSSLGFDYANNYLETSGAVFRLVHKRLKNRIYLILFNSHNGYYSHDFRVDVGGKKTLEGSL